MDKYVPFYELRAVFEKTGAAKYFSHLDLTRAVSRALRRSKLDLWFSEGFTPRPHLVFTPPLPLGSESVCELMDFRLKLGSPFDKSAFVASFPPALRVLDVYEPETKLKDIAFARYELDVETSCEKDAADALFSKPVILLKKTKRSETETDITKFIKTLDITSNCGIIHIDATLCCSADMTLSPAYLVSALKSAGYEAQALSVRRTAFFDRQMNLFV